MITWTNPDELGHLAPPATIPSLWAKHVGTAGVDDRVDHWYVTVPLQEVRFHGLPVARLERWYGKSNGISGWALVLDTRPEEARRLIDEREFRPDESGNFKPELLIDEESKDTKLVCDFSM